MLRALRSDPRGVQQFAVDDRIPVLYLAPWVDIGGADTATIDWFRHLDRGRFRPSLITTQPSSNRRLSEVSPYVDELWELPQLMAGEEFPRFILSFIHTRGIRLLHIMNSRLAFDLLPDIVSLPRRPRVVVQLHGEEPDQTGYCRFVTTRYGNLVDGFSAVCAAAVARLDAYDVPIGKRSLIPIGVDAEVEFSPDHVQVVEGLDPSAVHVLFAARLTAQKDPLLMVEVAARLRARGLRFQIHVLGDGELLDGVREAVVAAGLEREVLLHGASTDVAPWYAACQIALLTSAYETAPPRAAHEAMAMEVPLVAPALPEVEELVVDGTGLLVEPREDAEAYAEAIVTLARDRESRRAIGAAARARVRTHFTVQRMASEHGALYERLLSRDPAPSNVHEPPTARTALTALTARHAERSEEPLVSVVVTCFDQGRYLPDCLQSIARQTYRALETVVVDDGSTEVETLGVLEYLEQSSGVTLIRLPVNRGPSAARNAGIEAARGRYVLPLDGDDLLLENAVADMVGQLQTASEQIGFIYPNLQFFGNRDDYQQMPSYNLFSLLAGNHCATSSLIDREVFDRGLRYAEEITLGHEDWDFALTLAEQGIYGEPAGSKTVLCRKSGFTRSDLVNESTPARELIAARHPGLFERRAAIKAEWNPALSLIALDPLLDADDAAARLAAAVERQSCSDFELVTRAGLGSGELGGRLQRISSDPSTSRAEALREGLELSRGRYALALYGSPLELLGDVAFVEKVLRIMSSNPGVAALMLAGSGPGTRMLGSFERDAARPVSLEAVCWTTTGPAAPPTSLSLSAQRPLEALARWLDAFRTIEWRQLSRQCPAISDEDTGRDATLGAPRDFSARDAGLWEVAPLFPECPPGVPFRLSRMSSWRPPQSSLLCRHRERESGRYVYTNSEAPPPRCIFDHVIGCVRDHPFPGTVALFATADEPPFEFGGPADHSRPLMGFVEQQPLALFDVLLSGLDPATGQRVLLAGADDPLAERVRDATAVGYVEPYPIRPRPMAPADVHYGLAGLVRTVDLGVRCHRYAVGHVPPGVAAGELGSVFTEPGDDCDPLWIDDHGRVFVAKFGLQHERPSLRVALRWAYDPLTWRGFSRTAPKLRASARRALGSARVLTEEPNPNGRPREPLGYLMRSSNDRTVPLHAATHPVTGDLLLSTDASEAPRLGYGDGVLLGHLVAHAPVTGKLGPIPAPVPWAARFGMATSD